MKNNIKAQTIVLNLDPNALEKKRLPWQEAPSYLLREFIDLCSRGLGTAPEFVFGAALVTIAQAAGSRFFWKNDRFVDYPQAYVMLYGDAGTVKSPTMKHVIQPLTIIQNDEFRELPKDDPDISKKIKFNVFIGDTTLEGYWELAKNNPDGITRVNDEFTGLWGSFGAYKKNNSVDITYILRTFGDAEPYPIQRKGQPLSYIDFPITRILTGCQPEVLKNFFNDGQLFYNGFFPRFLFCMDDKDITPKRDDDLDLTKIDKKWEEVIKNIYGYRTGNVRLELSIGAKKIYNDYISENDILKRSGNLGSIEITILKKLEIYIIQISMMMAIFRTFETGEPIKNGEIIITEADMIFTRKCLDYFRYTGVKAYTDINSGKSTNKENISKSDAIYWATTNLTQYSDEYIGNFFGVSRSWVSKIRKLYG